MSDLSTLFDAEKFLPPPTESAESERETSAGPFAAVALEQGIDRLLDYSIPAKLRHSLSPGQRVRVPLGKNNRPAFGYVVSIHPTSSIPRIKNIHSIEDDRVLIGPAMMELARWMARYYLAPLGVVLESVIPAAVKRRIGIGYNSIVRLAQDHESTQKILEETKARKRRAILARLLQLEKDAGIELTRLAGEAGATPATVRKLARLGLITIVSQVDLPRLTRDMAASAGDEKPLELNEDQRKIFDELHPRVAAGGFSVNLLHGVTGSGKTEIYLQCIADAVAAGKRALVMVPEIALTPQTTRRFMARFQRVAILHSGLTATQRHKYWQQISQGHADVVVGARSSVFAPIPNLAVIVVDEEHDSSYKQDQAPRYHARDVAIKRAQLENIPIILGSATPSLEMYQRCAKPAADSAPGRYNYLSLPRRVRGLSLPTVELVNMQHDRRYRRGVHLISQRLEKLLQVTLEANHQAILLLNRRGYANFIYCPSCSNVIQCKYCDATMTYHRSAEAHVRGAASSKGVHTGQLHCHYCLAVNPLPEQCPVCAKKLSLFGLGTQRVEEELAAKFPKLRYARVDSDTMRNARDYESVLAKFSCGEIQVLLGTQMIAKGLDYPNVTLVGVISADTALALPDFRSAERTFQLITQVAGRAGRGDAPGRVAVQTFMPDDLTIRAALTQDYARFAEMELKNRQEVGLPPFTRIARIILRDQEQEHLHTICQELFERLTSAMSEMNLKIKMVGPMPCPIARIAGYFRNQIVLYSAAPEPIQKLLNAVRGKGGLERAERVAVDVDPVSLL
jgi:primosomal protein N' (replication factor Y) (superfamily II helicase)